MATNDTQKKSTNFNWKPITIILSSIALAATIYIGYLASISQEQIFPISVLALFAGLLVESYRISDNKKQLFHLFICAYAVSFISFIPNEDAYILNEHLKMWPYLFIGFYALLIMIFNEDKVRAQLTEGITLLQSLSMVYLAIEVGFLRSNGWMDKSIFYIILAFALFSIVHALTYLKLSRGVRLTLSMWSSFMMFVFAFYNIYKVTQNDIEKNLNFAEGVSVALQYFLLGVSIVYVFHNFMLLVAFLPSKHGNYKEDLKNAKEDHINRYSDTQTPISSSILCIIYACIVYGLNYKLHILPRNTMIWLVFFTAPMILKLLEFRNNKTIKN